MIINDLFNNKKTAVAEDANLNYIWIQGDFDGDTASTGPTQGSWRDQQSTPVKLTRGRMSNVRPLSGPPPEGGKTIKQAQIPLTLDAGDQKFSTTGVDLQLTMAPNGYVTNGEVGRVQGTAVVKIMRPESVEEDLTRRGFLRGLGAAALAGAAGGALAGSNDPNFVRKVHDQHNAMIEKNPRYAKEHDALGIYLARGIVGASAENNKRWVEKTAKLLQKYGVKTNEGVAENAGQPLSVQQLATISDEALDNAYGYGRSTPGNTFGWQANMKSAAYAKQIIDQGVTDIEAISDAIHKGWNTTAQAFVQNPDQFDDTAKLAAAGKLQAKLQQRAQLMKQNYAQLPEEEKEKDRVVARALVKAIKGDQSLSEGMAGKVVFSGTGANGSTYEIIQSSPTDFMIHANGKHIDTYGSLQRAMSVLQNEVPGLQQGMAEGDSRHSYENNYVILDPDGKVKAIKQNLEKARRWLLKLEKQFGPGYKIRPVDNMKNIDENIADDIAAAAQKKFPNAYISKNGEQVQKPENWGKPYTPPAAAPADLEKQQRDLTAKYPNIDELVRRAELNRDPDYEMADGQAYYAARDAEQNYQKLRQIQRVIQGLNESQADAKKKELSTGTGRINPDTGRPWTPSELKAKYSDVDFDKEAKKADLARMRDQAKQERLIDKLKTSLGDPRDTTSDLAKSFLNKGGLGLDFKPPGPRPTVPLAPEPVTVKGQPPGFTADNLAQQPGMAQYMQQKPITSKPVPNFAQGPAAYKTATTNVPPVATTTTAPPVERNDSDILQGLIQLQFSPKEARAAIKQLPPNISTKDAILQILRGKQMSESLTWSRNFDPGRSLYRQIKQDR